MKTATDMRSAVDISVSALWRATRFPLLATVLLLAPLVYMFCGVMMVGGVLAAILFQISAVGPRFPFLHVVGISLLFGVVMLLYYAVVAIILKD